MASKICPRCGAKNPSNVYSCQKCAASLIDVPSPSFPASNSSWSPESNSPASTAATNWEDTAMRGVDTTDEEATPPVTQLRDHFPATGEPIAVVRQSPWSSVLNALYASFFFLIFGFGAGVGSLNILWTILYFAAVVGIPIILGYFLRPKYYFYESYLLKESRGSSQQIDYSEIESVSQRRSRISLLLKGSQGQRFRNRGIAIPGDPKLPDGSDLASYLRAKIPPKAKSDDDKGRA